MYCVCCLLRHCCVFEFQAAFELLLLLVDHTSMFNDAIQQPMNYPVRTKHLCWLILQFEREGRLRFGLMLRLQEDA